MIVVRKVHLLIILVLVIALTNCEAPVDYRLGKEDTVYIIDDVEYNYDPECSPQSYLEILVRVRDSCTGHLCHEPEQNFRFTNEEDDDDNDSRFDYIGWSMTL